MMRRKLVYSLASFCLLCLLYSLVEPYLIRVNSFEFADPDVPASFNGKRIVFVADVHCGSLFSTERTRDLVERINGLEPDMILLGGDYIADDRVDLIEPCVKIIAGLHAPLGVYAVLGNHDHWADAGVAWRSLDENGIGILDNAAHWVNVDAGRIRVGGVGDLWEDTQDLEETTGEASEDDFVVLLSHNPDYAEEIMSDKVDLVLAGHTHGGQVTFFGLFAPYTHSAYGQKHISGFSATQHTTVYTTNGVGLEGLPMRFFAPPEIVEVTLRGEFK